MNGTSLDTAGQTLVAIHDWTFLFGPGFCVGVNGILLGWMMYRTGLMPPRLALLGVIGGPLIFLSSIAVLLGVYDQDGVHALFSVPEAAFEAAFAIYLIVKGFRPSPILDDARSPSDAPSRIRTCGLLLRRESLYPAELSGPRADDSRPPAGGKPTGVGG